MSERVDVLAVLRRDAQYAVRFRNAMAERGFDLHAVGKENRESDECVAAVAELIEREKAMCAALEEIARRPNHSLLEECAYVGAPTKKWMGERKHYSAGHTDSTREARDIATAALARVGAAT